MVAVLAAAAVGLVDGDDVAAAEEVEKAGLNGTVRIWNGGAGRNRGYEVWVGARV